MSDNPFERFAALGFTRLVPIIPPTARISEKSSLFKRVGTPQDGRGKTPGIRWRDGSWSGFDWLPYEADERDFRRWHEMRAGVGIKTGDGLVAIDADTTDSDCARIIRDAVEECFGRTPVRVGQYPKALYPLRVATVFPYSRVEFGPIRADDKGNAAGRAYRVEILSDGRQFVAHGVHPKTGEPYHWPRDLVALDVLPIASPAELTAFLELLRQRLPDTSDIVREGALTKVSQASLAGKPDLVRKAVQAVPNTSERFPSRESYRDFGYAIKAALPDDEPEALAIFEDWCARWDGGENDPDVVRSDWRRMKPPFRRGAPWLYELAEQTSNGTFSAAEVWLEDLDDPDNPFAAPIDPGAKKKPAASIRATPYDFPEPAAIPRRQMLYGHHYVRQFVSTTAAPTKVGKSSLTIVEGLAMASGRPLLGVKVAHPLRVWLWNGEDPIDELRRRVAAAMAHHGLTRADLVDEDGTSRLYVDSGRDMEIVLATSGRDGTRIAEPVESAVMETIRAQKIDVVVIDPFVSSHRVPENDNGGIDLVAKRWARIADRCGVAIELVHHVRKLNGGEVTIEDARGASALISAARSARALARMTRGEGMKVGLDASGSRRLFRFADAQSNLALPAGADDAWMQLASVDLGNWQDLGERGDSVGVVTLWDGVGEAHDGTGGTVADAVRARLLSIVRAGEWKKDPRSGDAWIGHAVAQVHKLDADDPLDRARVRAMVTEMIRAGVLIETTRIDAQRHQRVFVETPQADNLSPDIFA